MHGKNCFEDIWTKMSHKKKVWILFTVLPTLSPIFLTIIFDVYYGYTFKQVYTRHVLELILVNFAILVSIFSDALDSSDHKKRKIIGGLTGIIGFITTGIYCFFYGQKNVYLTKYTLTTGAFFLLLAIATMKIGSSFYDAIDDSSLSD